MNAVVYVFVRQYINRVKRIFSKPLSAILTVLAVLCFLSGPIFSFIVPYKGLVGDQGRELVIAGMQLFIGVTLIASALSQQGGLFKYAEANILFSAPFSKRTILLYSTFQTVPASILTAMFMSFYFPFVIGSAMTGLKLLATLLVMALMVFCIYILYYYIYIQDIAYPGLKNRLKKVTLLGFAVIAVIFAATWENNGRDVEAAAVTFLTSSFYNAFPVFGWAKWAIAALLNGQYFTGFIPALLLLAGFSYVLARVYYSLDVEFYEKAQLDSIRLQQVVDNLKSSGYDARGITIKKVRQAKGDFKPGARAIMSRQLLEMKKRGPMIALKELISGGIYIVIGLAMGLGFEFVCGMVLFALIGSTSGDGWNSEFKRPYIYLIPETSFKKVIYTVIPDFIKTLFSVVIVMTAAAAAYKIEPLQAIFYILLMATYTLLFVAAGVFTYRILGRLSNAIVLLFLRMLLMMLSTIPGGILAVVLYFATGSAAIPVMITALVFANIAVALLLLLMSRRLFEQSELMN